MVDAVVKLVVHMTRKQMQWYVYARLVIQTQLPVLVLFAQVRKNGID